MYIFEDIYLHTLYKRHIVKGFQLRDYPVNSYHEKNQTAINQAGRKRIIPC